MTIEEENTGSLQAELLICCHSEKGEHYYAPGRNRQPMSRKY